MEMCEMGTGEFILVLIDKKGTLTISTIQLRKHGQNKFIVQAGKIQQYRLWQGYRSSDRNKRLVYIAFLLKENVEQDKCLLLVSFNRP